MHTGRMNRSVQKRAKVGTHTYITALDLYALACFVQTIFVERNSFQGPRDSQSPAEMRAVMATEENSGCSMRACLLGQACTRAENWDAAEVWAERISHECVSNYHSEADKGFQNNEQKQSSLLCWRWHCVRVNPRFNTERKLEKNVQRCELITSQKPKNVLLINKSFFSCFKLLIVIRMIRMYNIDF